MLPITGYSDRYSARPGETVAFKIDCRDANEFSARLVRVRCGDPNPAGPSGAIPTWPVYDPATDPFLELDADPVAGQGIRTDKCDFWDSLAR